jgi:nucleotide-binding universal stress UspA family protein
MAATARPVIVAGVDGFDDSKEALRWAARQARLTGAEVHAVTAWQVPARVFAMPDHGEADYAGEARQALDAAVREALGPDPDVPVVTRLVQQRPATALVEEAAHADLLVVGGRGRGELPGVHLGTVASYCTHHAPCPVVVVHQAGSKNAVAAYRELIATQPAAFRPAVAEALTSHSVQLADLGRPRDALTAIEEAVTAYRELNEAQPGAFRPDLAAALTSQSVRLADLGRREEALAAIEEAVAIRRDLATTQPGAFRPDLATSLNNLSICLADLGRREEALAAIEEAVAIRREQRANWQERSQR